MLYTKGMLDKRTVKLLENLIKICGDGSYKIIEIEDLIKGMAPRYKLDAEAIAQIISFLSDAGMIDIKYSDDKVHCVAVLPKGRVFEESQGSSSPHAVASNRKLAILTVIAAFAGALVGAFIGTVLF
jgi:hypothetical protein